MKLFSLLLLMAITVSLYAQIEKTAKKERVYQNVVGTELHFYPGYNLNPLLDGETNTVMLPTFGASFNYTGRIMFKKQRHFFDIGANISIYTVGVQLAPIDNTVRRFPMQSRSGRSTVGLSVGHNIVFHQVAGNRFFASYGMRMLYLLTEGGGSESSGVGNGTGTINHMAIASRYYGGRNEFNNNDVAPFVPMIDIGIGMELATKKGFGQAWTMELHFSWDFIRRMAHAEHSVLYYTTPANDPTIILEQGSGSFHSHLSSLSLKFGKKF
ncbi:MAG: hypothetical protein MK212_11720 [Saprospiraceae bacterium]|nr:hypothetical protein [Saprospiraceae bacterium]